jgi:hypothetical protein
VIVRKNTKYGINGTNSRFPKAIRIIPSFEVSWEVDAPIVNHDMNLITIQSQEHSIS